MTHKKERLIKIYGRKCNIFLVVVVVLVASASNCISINKKIENCTENKGTKKTI